jgi:DNA (cytosine-5)-methyltransferase 1
MIIRRRKMKSNDTQLKCLELFTGAGGLAMGLGRAGFSHAGVVEFNHDACETMRFNKGLRGSPLKDWNIHESDTRSIPNFATMFPGIRVVAGGPPCQPFSMGGKAQGPHDSRDMFPEAVRAVRDTRPIAFIFENVKGLLRETFTDYFEYVILQMTYPSIARRSSESISAHRARLERAHTKGQHSDLSYRVVWQLLNAADFGIPQRRERVFMVGFRSDLQVAWAFPEATHSKEALDYQKLATGEYFDRHDIARRGGREGRQLGLGARGSDYDRALALRPWRTVRDAISDLPDPESDSVPEMNHVFIPGARAYPGHTGSPIDEPAKTLKAGDHGVPGGENMLSTPNGRVRYFTLREAARLQTFPDTYLFNRSWTESMRQLGNAVPVELGEVVAKSVRASLGKVC